MGYNIIRPRRGIKSLWDQYKSRIYKQGEMLVESPETGVGSGPVNIKFGDGVTDYEHLPYAVQAPTSELAKDGTAPMTNGAGYELKQLIESGSGTVPKHTHTKAEVGLGNVDNTADSQKSVKYAASAGSATNATNATTAASCTGNSATATKATQDGNGNNIVSTYKTKAESVNVVIGATAPSDTSALWVVRE